MIARMHLLRSPVLLLTAAFVLIHVAMDIVYLIDVKYLPGWLFNSVDESLKVVVAIGVTLGLRHTKWIIGIVGLGIILFPILPHTTLLEGLYKIYISQNYFPDRPDFWLEHLFTRTAHFWIPVVLLVGLREKTNLRYSRTDDSTSPPWEGQYSISTLIFSVFSVAVVMGTARFAHSLGLSNVYLIYAADGIRVTLAGLACLLAVFVPRQRVLWATGALALSVGSGMLAVFAFELDHTLRYWLYYAVVQFLVITTSLWVVRSFGYTLTTAPKNALPQTGSERRGAAPASAK